MMRDPRGEQTDVPVSLPGKFSPGRHSLAAK
jgi:hypothetical protein